MRERFASLNPKHIEGLNWWFWIKENWAYVNSEAADMIMDYLTQPPNVFKHWREWLMFLAIPFFYLLAIFIGPYMRKHEAFENAKPDYETMFYNKKNIEYITILHTLSGGANGR